MVSDKRAKIDLFTDAMAILNLLDLRSIMGCPGGTRSVFTLSFRAKRELHGSRKRRSLLHPNTAQRSFFPITVFFKENLKKNWPSEYIGSCSFSLASHKTP